MTESRFTPSREFVELLEEVGREVAAMNDDFFLRHLAAQDRAEKTKRGESPQ